MSRQPQRVHKTFYRLKLRANFFIGNALYEKTTFCTARLLENQRISGARINLFVAPWRVVRSDEFVKKKITVNKSAESARIIPDHETWEASGGTTPEQNEARDFPKQPHSDNNITGPTS